MKDETVVYEFFAMIGVEKHGWGKAGQCRKLQVVSQISAGALLNWLKIRTVIMARMKLDGVYHPI